MNVYRKKIDICMYILKFEKRYLYIKLEKKSFEAHI